MSNNKSYAGIDRFRFIAALLVVAIHTSPLLSFSETGDFILTRVIARTAVPFFLMTSGFFLITRYAKNADKLRAFIKSTLLIYIISIVIYIPINIYNGYFSGVNLLPNIIKDIVFDGTMYHLWYLPAAAIGAAIAWYVVRKFNYTKAFAITSVLYIIGLLGDSYYGIAEKISGVRGFYDLIFQVSDYTRNGIFMAPVFFVIGGYLKDTRRRDSLGKNICGLAASFAFMLAEAMLLRHFGMQRHDSMYIFLIPCMFFLFSTLLHFTGKRSKWLRTSALIVYMIHPMMIVAIRLAAKIVGMQKLLIDNSIIHFAAAAVSSVVFSFAAVWVWNKIKKDNKKNAAGKGRAWIELDIENLEHNVNVLQKAMPSGCALMAVVKTAAYGHGSFEVSANLCKMGVRAFAVATIDEGIALRKYGVEGEILILGYTDVLRAREIKKYNLIQTVIDHAYARDLNEQGVKVKAHIKIDTGMHRLGISSDDVSEVKEVFDMPNINVCGIYTHLSCSDSLALDDIDFTKEQIEKFYALIDILKKDGYKIPKLHIQGSYGLLNYPELECDYVRIGIALCGVLSSPHDLTKLLLDLKPVLSLKTKVALIRDVSKGSGIGYNRTFTTDRDSRIAILPIGYGDGVPRSLSCGKGSVIINNRQAPIIGRVCMDQLTVDITDIENVSVGDTAMLIGKDDLSEIPAPVVAENAESISNELLCRMGARLPVIEK